MKNIILLNFFILFFLSSTPSWAVDYPTIPTELDSKTFCDDDGGKFGHVITVIDLTSDLDVAQIKFIKDQVFSKEFYLGYYPFTKFSYILIDNKAAQTQEFHFSKCRPKTGDKKLRKAEKADWNENPQVLKSISNKFFLQASKLHKEKFSNKKSSNNSFIFETIFYIFQNPKSDFGSKHARRDLIIASDMMQYSDRFSFYEACNARSSEAKCPSLDDFMESLSESDRDYLTANAPDGTNINLKMIYLNHRYETNKEIDSSLKKLWVDYFNRRNFKKVKVIPQLDIKP